MIEIKELIIRATVDAHNGMDRESGVQKTAEENLTKEYLGAIVEQLKNTNER